MQTNAQSKAKRPSRRMFDALSRSPVYQEYARAFTEATGLPVELQAAEMGSGGGSGEQRFCHLMGRTPQACADCLTAQRRLQQDSGLEPRTITCEFGMCETAVPVQLAGCLAGYLITGQSFQQRPTEAQFNRVVLVAAARDASLNEGELRRAWFATRVLTPGQHAAAVKLLVIFSQHLGLLSSQFLMQEATGEPPAIVKARVYIEQHLAESLTLGRVAAAVHTSSCYFCKLFKQATGVNFTDYLARLRINKARELLLDPNRRISEVAYAVGFQSLTHFNRVFKRLEGCTPGAYRTRAALSASA